MDTIKMYIENLFQSLPKTNEVIRAKEELIAMMEDKYNELKIQGKSENEAIGIVISEFGNIDELKEELGINNNSNGYENNTTNKGVPVRSISLEETKDFIQSTSKFALKIAMGVILCILSVVPLIILVGLSGGDNSIDVANGILFFEANAVPEKVALAIGLTILFVFVAIAVALFIISGLQYEKYSYIKKENFELDYLASNYVKDLKENETAEFGIKITLGVILCIISVIPVVIAGTLFDDLSDGVAAVCVGLLLIIVAASVYLFITAGMKRDSYKQLLHEEEYASKNVNNDDLAGKVASVYWPIATAIYLGWSFITMDWGRTWIVWPIAGVLFGGIAAVCNIIAPGKKEGN
ncbi:permease prefix domain 1-containing protein [[Clostridium] fimetarium]|uniref:GPI biosynthesis protein family Pig-F n=1 Tax=[Clostridium] fimetarium TaxID=99656 RepID=A0A1I0NJ93_9FIRM|nr:permease prefix domain 1-containing protein [[Clostridium] fimetarium]SEW01375.1 GPI biosynthesis protein family Pig-F [[Clostridium] fimetarium]